MTELTPSRSLPHRIREATSRVPGLPPRVQSALGWLAIVIVGLLVAVLVFAALAPRLFGIHFVMVAGGSMEPTIPFGSLAVMRDVSPSGIEVDDIVLYPAPGGSGTVVTHRVVAFDDNGQLITRGDANARDDDWRIAPEDVQREYIFAIPELGSAVQWLGSPVGYFLVVLIPGLVIVGGELRSIVRTVASSRRARTDGESSAQQAEVADEPLV